LFYSANQQNLIPFDQISLFVIATIIYADQDRVNREAITQALMVMKLHNVNCTKQEDLIHDPAPFLPYSQRYRLVLLLEEFPGISVKAAKDYQRSIKSFKRRVQRAFKKIEVVLNHLAKK
jgi:hypothetical protein